MQGGLSYERNVRLSVRPSAKRVNYNKMKETCAHILIPYERPIHLVFRYEKQLVGDDPLYLKCWAKLTQFLRKRQFSIDFCS